VKLGRRDDPAYYARLREVFDALRRALLAGLTALVLAGVGAAWNAWAFIPAAIAAVFAVGDAWLVLKGGSAAAKKDWVSLLDGRPCRAGDARAREYGVDTEALPEGVEWRYIERDFEEELRGAIERALSGEGSRLVMLSGPTKAGKTRAAFQALGWEALRDGQLVAPRDGASVEALLEDDALPAEWRPLVIWLDDIERYASVDATGFHPGTLRNLKCDRPVLLLATEGGRGRSRYTKDSELVDPVQQLRDLAVKIEVPVEPTTDEQARIESAYGEEFAAESERVGLGRRMVAVNELAEKLTSGRRDPSSGSCREGVAVIRAAIDWRRMGAQSPLGVEQIDALYRHHLPDDLDPSPALLESGMRWARELLPKTEISLLPKAGDGSDRYEPYDLAVEVARKTWPAIDEQAREQIVSVAKPLDAFQMANVAYRRDDKGLALRLFAQAESADDRPLAGASANNVGVILRERGDIDDAEAAWRRADERGNANGAFNLGQLMRMERGDMEGALAAYRRADERGHASGASAVGAFVRERGDLDGAEAAFRRADERGDAAGAFNLGQFLREDRGDIEGALAAYQRADERGDAAGACNLGVTLRERGDIDGALAAFRRGDERGDADSACNLGVTLRERGDIDGALAAFRHADERGHADGAYNLGVMLQERGDPEGAADAFRRAEEREAKDE
jgi:tetratricopeptide (TPR) repeat protein